MRWDEVMTAVLAMLNADAALVAELGGQRIYAAQSSRPVQVPSVEWVLLDDTESKLWNPIEVQFDYWAHSMAKAAAIERRLRTLLSRETGAEVGGVGMTMRYVDSYTPGHPTPGVIHRALRFRFEPVRPRYVPSVA